MRQFPALLFVLGATSFQPVARATSAQVSARSNVDQLVSISERSTLELSLTRPLAPGEGELALVVGGVDVTAVSERTPSTVAYRPTALPLPSGETDVVLYQRRGARWSEIRRLSVRVVQAASGSQLAFSQSATLGNKGQVAEGRTGAFPPPDRRTFQDFALNGGWRASHDDGPWGFATQSNYVGVTHRQDALGFATRGSAAPLLDLADYTVGLKGPNSQLAFGNVTFGNSRHLANNFAARGGTLAISHDGTSIGLGAMAGSPEVGWTDLTGLDRPTDRIFGASLGQEMVDSHPGALRLDLNFIDGSKQPRPSFTQSAVVDAEQSTGGSVQMSAGLPNQRARLTSGFTRSRFDNPGRDPQLLGDTTLKRPRPATADARFVEANVVALQNAATPFGAPANMAFTVRDDRVDPLFRSVAGQAQADRQTDAADATVAIGAISGQVSTSWTRDNLGDVQSVLTTHTSSTTASLAIPVAAVGGARVERVASYLPILAFTFNATHQAAAGTPVNGAFRPTDLPDQFNSVGDVSATWQSGQTRFLLHANVANQDNRQPTRENADFDSGVFGVSIGRSVGARGDMGVDLGDEYQTARERDETTRTRRMTFNGSFRARATLNLLGAFSMIDARAPTGKTTVNTEQHLEVSQGFNLWPTPASEPQRGQLFARFARTGSLVPLVSATGVVSPSATRTQWTVATGLNFRLF